MERVIDGGRNNCGSKDAQIGGVYPNPIIMIPYIDDAVKALVQFGEAVNYNEMLNEYEDAKLFQL